MRGDAGASPLKKRKENERKARNSNVQKLNPTELIQNSLAGDLEYLSANESKRGLSKSLALDASVDRHVDGRTGVPQTPESVVATAA